MKQATKRINSRVSKSYVFQFLDHLIQIFENLLKLLPLWLIYENHLSYTEFFVFSTILGLVNFNLLQLFSCCFIDPFCK